MTTAITISSRARRLVCRYERWMPTLPGGPRTPLSYVGALSPLRSPSLSGLRRIGTTLACGRRSRHTPAASLRPRPRQLPKSSCVHMRAMRMLRTWLACRVDRAVVGMRPAACCPQETAHAHARQMQAVSPCRWNNLRHKFPNEYKFPLNWRSRKYVVDLYWYQHLPLLPNSRWTCREGRGDLWICWKEKKKKSGQNLAGSSHTKFLTFWHIKKKKSENVRLLHCKAVCCLSVSDKNV